MGLKGKTEGLSPKIFCRSERPLNVSSSLLCRPEPLFLSPRAKRGAPWGRRPEQSEGCLANAGHDGL